MSYNKYCAVPNEEIFSTKMDEISCEIKNLIQVSYKKKRVVDLHEDVVYMLSLFS